VLCAPPCVSPCPDPAYACAESLGCTLYLTPGASSAEGPPPWAVAGATRASKRAFQGFPDWFKLAGKTGDK